MFRFTAKAMLGLLVVLCLSACNPGKGQEGSASSSSDAANTTAVRFASGQKAAHVMSEGGFNDAGYLNTTGDGLLFNHQKGIASDGSNLVVADGGNNRVLIWNTAPTGNTKPDVVLGQPDLIQTNTNNASDSLAQLSWPVDVAIGGGKLFVSDTENDRILVWNSMPTANNQPADYAITNPDLLWPWGIWTDGTKLMATSTLNGKVLVWNSIPTVGNEAPDLILTSNGEMGTPRVITTDGSSYLMVSDHNPKRSGMPNENGVFYWTTFPTADTASDAFFYDFAASYWMGGVVDSLGRIYWMSNILHRFDSAPTPPVGSNQLVDYTKDQSYGNYLFAGGDGTDLAIANNRLYVSLPNNNKIVAYASLPASSTDEPSIVIGSNSIVSTESSLVTRLNYMTNPTPVCDGEHLLVASDFDREIRFYNQPIVSDNPAPNFSLKLSVQPRSLRYAGGKLLVYAQADGKLLVWDTLPADASATADKTYTVSASARDVTFDGSYLYLLENNEVRIWDISSQWPADLNTPEVTVKLNDSDTLMGRAESLYSNDGIVLIDIMDRHKILVFDRDQLVAGNAVTKGAIGGSPSSSVQFNLPAQAIYAHGKIMVADTSFNRVHVWDSLDTALTGAAPDAILGQKDASGKEPTKAQDGLFMPAKVCFDGKSLFVGEFKFSGRLLKYEGRPVN